ncbi:hypothetical protein [Geodermatophilus dictyosporus]|uniref:hypothetical protein n=1 Tax=Geodermatophilus dictyosporus TaxID=1523247 RepID=UPI0010AB2211|nr:hypothetical protein [Geodermatophilus dictyosporus]
MLDELVTAGRELLRSLETLNDDEEFWDDLTAVERRVDRSSRADLLRLREVLDHDLLGILPALGYRPPPSELEFADAVQDTLAALLGPPRPERGDARRVERAHQELSWFLIRFRRLLDDRACSASARTAGPEERASARVRVAAWLRRAVSAAVPAAVAAGTLGAIMGPQAGVAAGLAAGSSEALKQLVQVGAADAMGRVLGAEGLPQPEGLAADLESAVDTAVQRVAGVAHRPPGDPVREGAVFLLRRALYRVLQAGPEVDGVAPLQGWCEEAVRLLRSAPLEQVVGYWRHGDQAVPPPSPAAVPPRPTGTFVW